MAWDDVPQKLIDYDAETYATDNASATLLAEYGVTDVNDVPEHRREDFETDLDYRLGACQNLAKSKAVRP
jgi:hypothetical protein